MSKDNLKEEFIAEVFSNFMKLKMERKDKLIKKLRKEIRRLKNRSPDAVIRGMK